jgi:hypothetical protein
MKGNSTKHNAATSPQEWICRSLFTLNAYLVMSGLFTYAQTDYQLLSVLIPRSIVDQTAGPYMYGSLGASLLLIPSLWFYFFRKLTVVIVLQIISIILYFGFQLRHWPFFNP